MSFTIKDGSKLRSKISDIGNYIMGSCNLLLLMYLSFVNWIFKIVH
jgi:hypothetical protein